MGFWNKKDDDSDASTMQQAEKTEEKPKTAPQVKETLAAPKPSSTKAKIPAMHKIGAGKPQKKSSPEEAIADRFGSVRSALGEGTVIQGKLSFDTPVRIDGKLKGEIFSSKALIVGPSGEIDAQVEVACLVILGKVKGTVKASERIELWSTGSISGDIDTAVLIMEENSSFDGSCKMRVGTTDSSIAKIETKKDSAAKAPSGKKPDQAPAKDDAAKTDSKDEIRVH
ncbi:polymer-forming cytoskeletal protein [Oligoflexia bacterium]|nr:polymer-forming cytoskeletal protein [Oligoflexia bacterium]